MSDLISCQKVVINCAKSNWHSRVMDFLDGGIASSARVDGLGKGIGEFLRSRIVDIPSRFLRRGWVSGSGANMVHPRVETFRVDA